MKLSACVLVLMLAAPPPAHAQTSEEFARKSRVLWAAYQCSYYAEGTGRSDEQTRLFELGYQNGLAFLTLAVPAPKRNGISSPPTFTIKTTAAFYVSAVSRGFMMDSFILNPVPLPPYLHGPFKPGDLAPGDKITVRRNGRLRVGRVRGLFRRGVRYVLLPYGYECAARYENVLKVHLPGPCPADEDQA